MSVRYVGTKVKRFVRLTGTTVGRSVRFAGTYAKRSVRIAGTIGDKFDRFAGANAKALLFRGSREDRQQGEHEHIRMRAPISRMATYPVPNPSGRARQTDQQERR